MLRLNVVLRSLMTIAVVSSAPYVLGSESAPGADTTQSEPPALKSEIAQSRGLLAQLRYADLDQRMNAFQEAYRTGALDEFALLQEFTAFSIADPSMQGHFDAWVTAFPHSYAARLARGIYYFKSGIQTRGTRYAAHTTEQQMRGMKFYLDKAQPDLQASLALDAKPMVSYNYLIRIGMEIGQKESNRSLLDAALKLDPVALLARRPYLKSLETRWGGSLDQMLAFMDESRNAGLGNGQLAVLQQLIDAERQWLKRLPGGDESTVAASGT
jgi:hypothetical protein